jgi:hypothetical protein
MKPAQKTDISGLIQDLTASMRRALTDSPEVVRRLKRIRSHGYEASVSIEATIGLSRVDPETTAPSRSDARIEAEDDALLHMSPLDKKFLRSLRISVDDDE